MKNLFLLLSPSIFALIFFSVFLSFYSYPNTYIGTIDVSLKTKKEIKSILEKKFKNPVKIQIKDRVYAYSPTQIGINFDQDFFVNNIFKKNKIPIMNIYYFAQSLNSDKILKPQISFSNLFDGWFNRTVFDFSIKKDEIAFDTKKKEVRFISNEEKYRIDTENLRDEVSEQYSLIRDLVIKPKLIKIDELQKANTAKLLNETYQKVVGQPISLLLDPKDPAIKISLEPSEIKQILQASFINDSMKITANKDTLKTVVMGKIVNISKLNEKEIDNEKIYNDILALADSRVMGIGTNTIQASTKYKPNTNGDKANKYIEIDISQQQMYIWEKGNVIAEHLVSTGLYYPTPPGQYKILNKATNAYSYIYNVWMPYWMAFYLAPDIKAYLGIHELPYWISNGTQIRRPREFLGTPKTGGCVSLDVGVAEKVFAWADVGTPVYIFN